MKAYLCFLLSASVIGLVMYLVGNIHGVKDGAIEATKGYRECMQLPDGEMYCWLTEKGKAHRAALRGENS